MKTKFDSSHLTRSLPSTPSLIFSMVSYIDLIDELQNMETETETAKVAIASLNPLCTLWYSACDRRPVATGVIADGSYYADG